MNFQRLAFLLMISGALFCNACKNDSDGSGQDENETDTSATSGIEDRTGDDADTAGESLVSADTIETGETDAEPLTGSGGEEKELKIGYVNSMEILYKMPEVAAAERELQQYAQSLDKQYQEETQKFQEKYQRYMEDNTVSETVQKARAQEMQDMQQSLMNLQSSSEEEIQKKRDVLFKPIEEKVNRVIRSVAQENGYTHVLDAASILYIEDAYNLTPQVKQALNIQN